MHRASHVDKLEPSCILIPGLPHLEETGAFRLVACAILALECGRSSSRRLGRRPVVPARKVTFLLRELTNRLLHARNVRRVRPKMVFHVSRPEGLCVMAK